MDYRYLKAFLFTAKFNSFSRAAEELKIAQSAVSRQIKLLEESVNEELIIRSSKKVILTDKGKDLYVAAMNFDELTKDLFIQDGQRTIRVGVLDGLLENWFNTIMVKYYKKFNNNIKVTIDTPNVLKGLLSEGKLDIIFTTENIQSELISSLKLFDEKLVLISKNKIDLQKAFEHRWIGFSEGDHIFQAFKKDSANLLTVDSMTSKVNLVKNNVGIAVIPDHALRSADNLVITPLKNLKKSEIFMATLSFKTMPKYLEEISQIIQLTMKK